MRATAKGLAPSRVVFLGRRFRLSMVSMRHAGESDADAALEHLGAQHKKLREYPSAAEAAIAAWG
jgi:hypothetical protein